MHINYNFKLNLSIDFVEAYWDSFDFVGAAKSLAAIVAKS